MNWLGELLRRGDIGPGLVLAGLGVAFGLGALHALSPGHGKTIVAAYLVGTRGTFRHALYLGGIVTFTHTASVFALGIATLFLSRYVLPDRIMPVLGAVSGISIVWVGSVLLWRRVHALRHEHDHHHHHHQAAEVSMAGLVALGASGGLVPCPSALVLLLSAVTLRRVGLGLLLLVGFSAGLAVVLTAIGALAIYAKHLLPDEGAARSRFFRLAPVISAAVIVVVGLAVTGFSWLSH
jgi:nickel/cobalt exporter